MKDTVDLKIELTKRKKLYYPLDEIFGILQFTNHHDRQIKLRKIKIIVVEHWMGYGFVHYTGMNPIPQWSPNIKVLQKTQIMDNYTLIANETHKVPFAIILPNIWKPKKLKPNKQVDWQLGLSIQCKGLIFMSPPFLCQVPVEGQQAPLEVTEVNESESDIKVKDFRDEKKLQSSVSLKKKEMYMKLLNEAKETDLTFLSKEKKDEIERTIKMYSYKIAEIDKQIANP